MKYLLLTTAAVLLSSCLATDQDIFIDLPDIPPSDGDSAADRTRACEVLFAVDDKLWEKRGRNMTHLAETAHFMVNRLNDIFVSQVFIDDYDDLYFRLARIQVSSSVENLHTVTITGFFVLFRKSRCEATQAL